MGTAHKHRCVTEAVRRADSILHTGRKDIFTLLAEVFFFGSVLGGYKGGNEKRNKER